MTHSHLIELADRVEAGQGSDYALRGAIAETLGWHQTTTPTKVGNTGYPPGWWVNPRGEYRQLPKWEGSIDAVAALAEEMLPRWAWRVEVYSDHTASAKFIGDEDKWGVDCKAPARALLAALLRALAAVVQKETI